MPAIELLQMHIIRGATRVWADVITNTLGAALGVARGFVARAGSPDREASAATALGRRSCLDQHTRRDRLGFTLLLADTTLWGEWAPEILHFDVFPGTIVSARAAGFALPPGAMGSDPLFRRRLVSDSVLVSAVVVPGAPTDRTAPIAPGFTISRTNRGVLAVSAAAVARLFDPHERRTRDGSRSDHWPRRNVFPAAAATRDTDDTLHVAGGILHRALVIRARDVERHISCARAARPPQSGVGLDVLLTMAVRIRQCDVGALRALAGRTISPTGVLGSADRTAQPSSARVGHRAPAGLVAAPPIMGGAFVGWAEWLGVIAGGAAGLSLGTMSEQVGRTAHERAENRMCGRGDASVPA